MGQALPSRMYFSFVPFLCQVVTEALLFLSIRQIIGRKKSRIPHYNYAN